MKFSARLYQSTIIGQTRHTYIGGFRAPLIVLPTGGGKTFIFCHIAERMTAKGKRAVILVHRQELLMQASRSLRDLNVAHGLIAPGWKYRGETIAVASVQTLAGRIGRLTKKIAAQAHPSHLDLRELNQLTDFDLIIVDEAHHAVAGTWKKIIAALPKARLLGVTATPMRADGKGLGIQAGGCFDALVEGPSIEWLISEGYLVAPLTYAPPTKIDLSEVHMRGADYNQKELAGAVDKPRITGDAVAHYARLCPFKPAIVFCASIEHARHVAAEFQAAGFVAKSLDGTMSDSERRAGISGLADGSIHVLTSCDIISEGTDIPVVSAAIMLRPTQSEGLYMQQGGRALRPVYAEGFDLSTSEGRLAAIAASDKPHALILDHVGNCFNHGLLDAEREWSLAGRKKKKRKVGETAIPLKQCPSCYAFHKPAPRCLHCGHEYETNGREIEKVDGELKPLTFCETQKLKKQRKKERYNSIETLEDAFVWAIKSNYKNPPFWSAHYMRQSRKVDIPRDEILQRWDKFQQERGHLK